VASARLVSAAALIVPPPTDLERDLQLLASELRKLEAEYNMYFGGRLPRPPNETRARVEALLKRLDRAPFEQVAQRFRLQSLQSRYATFAELWDRNLRTREEGRGGRRTGPAAPPAAPPQRVIDRVVHDASIRDPRAETDRLHVLYDALSEARREAGESSVPFGRFEQIVVEQVAQMREEGAGEVAFRVAVKNGKARLTARATRTVAE
jgi:hypothetical protein